jgi:hypothetical protein
MHKGLGLHGARLQGCPSLDARGGCGETCVAVLLPHELLPLLQPLAGTP